MKTKNIFRYLLLMAMFSSILFAETVGNLKGALSVNQGSMSYSVDILTPPGVAGVEPKLSFEYNQNSGNGHLGVGWSIGGLSAISRCGQTITQDGQNRGLKYDYSDNYCMDGQRLIPVQGSKGKNGTEYRTEVVEMDRHTLKFIQNLEIFMSTVIALIQKLNFQMVQLESGL